MREGEGFDPNEYDDFQNQRRETAQTIGFQRAWGEVKRRRRVRRGCKRVNDLYGGTHDG